MPAGIRNLRVALLKRPRKASACAIGSIAPHNQQIGVEHLLAALLAQEGVLEVQPAMVTDSRRRAGQMSSEDKPHRELNGARAPSMEHGDESSLCGSATQRQIQHGRRLTEEWTAEKPNGIRECGVIEQVESFSPRFEPRFLAQ